jgi:hypothetical protein
MLATWIKAGIENWQSLFVHLHSSDNSQADGFESESSVTLAQ